MTKRGEHSADSERNENHGAGRHFYRPCHHSTECERNEDHGS